MQNKSKKPPTKSRRCTYCGAYVPVIWVHGHGQCAACGTNVAECCQGEQRCVDTKKSASFPKLLM